ncbi:MULTISPECIES: YbaB/EbfC family nucleoid-associated protein [Olsenella]|uniref:YbaB/EbfC family nucleoid-associated protein n=1 Tax=Olsenella TaxID=133925 RepID=UPI00071E5989|nr:MULTISPECIES: YbaB/EbfC family nucleoid-associated protein [Olsenella]OFK22198.1 nucleoid-associated protein [Olsenella sp. HMSC062G07]
MNMQQMMKQAQKMQRQLADAQDKLGQIEVSASAGGGLVKVTGTADMRITSVTIDPDALDPEDVDLLQDTVVAAVNECLSSAKEAANRQLGAVTGGMSMPGLF